MTNQIPTEEELFYKVIKLSQSPTCPVDTPLLGLVGELVSAVAEHYAAIPDSAKATMVGVAAVMLHQALPSPISQYVDADGNPVYRLEDICEKTGHSVEEVRLRLAEIQGDNPEQLFLDDSEVFRRQ